MEGDSAGTAALGSGILITGSGMLAAGAEGVTDGGASPSGDSSGGDDARIPLSLTIGVLAGRLRSTYRSGLGGDGNASTSCRLSAGAGGGGSADFGSSRPGRCEGTEGSVGKAGRSGKDGKSSRTGLLVEDADAGAGLVSLKPSEGTDGRASSNCLPKLSREGKFASKSPRSSRGTGETLGTGGSPRGADDGNGRGPLGLEGRWGRAAGILGGLVSGVESSSPLVELDDGKDDSCGRGLGSATGEGCFVGLEGRMTGMDADAGTVPLLTLPPVATDLSEWLEAPVCCAATWSPLAIGGERGRLLDADTLDVGRCAVVDTGGGIADGAEPVVGSGLVPVAAADAAPFRAAPNPLAPPLPPPTVALAVEADLEWDMKSLLMRLDPLPTSIPRPLRAFMRSAMEPPDSSSNDGDGAGAWLR